MIAHIKGILSDKDTKRIVVDVNGIGYSVDVAERTVTRLPAIGEEVTFYTYYTQNRDHEIKLYGFTSKDALKMFEMALTVTRVGPSLAQNILTVLSPSQFQQAVLKEDIRVLMRVPRLGKELAQLIILKLKKNIAKIKLDEKVELVGTAATHQAVINLLLNLQASELEAEEALKKAIESIGEDADRDALVKEALRYIRN